MFILASGSPRRQELLHLLGCEFEVCVSHAEEITGADILPAKLVLQNAEAKATEVAARRPELPVLGADTVVALGRRIYGKPGSRAEAEEMLHSLSNCTHQVFTGVVFVWHGESFQAVETTEVSFGPMSDDEISAYVAGGEPMDKAGAYAIQGQAEAFIRGIQGSWSNVVGLPLYCVRTLAGKAGVNLYGNHGERSAV